MKEGSAGDLGSASAEGRHPACVTYLADMCLPCEASHAPFPFANDHGERFSARRTDERCRSPAIRPTSNCFEAARGPFRKGSSRGLVMRFSKK